MTLIKWNTPRSIYNGTNYPSVASLINNVLQNDLLSDRAANFLPAVNIAEDSGSFVIELSAPGFKKEDFNVKLDDNVLTISAEQKAEKTETEKSFTRKEFSYGSFERSFTLPETANSESVEAKYESGILKLVIAKKEENKVKPVKEIKIS